MFQPLFAIKEESLDLLRTTEAIWYQTNFFFPFDTSKLNPKDLSKVC